MPTSMRGYTLVFAASAFAALALPTVAGARSASRLGPVPADADRFVAQYDGQGYGAPGYGPEGYGPEGYGPGGYGPDGFDQGYGEPPPGAAPRFREGRGEDPEPRAARGGTAVSYHGFKIHLAYPAGSPEGEAELEGAERQVDIVEHAGLGGAALRLFRAQPIDFGGRSHFTRHTVVLGDLQGKGSRPVLLHEFMHIYHRNHLPGGFNNPTIRHFYEQALASNAYPQGSYMLSNVQEYFAMTASCYLNGTIARPPFNRETIREAQPAYYAYLAHLFGRG